LPVLRDGFSGVVDSVSIGSYTNCAVISGGSIDCWWINASGSPPGSPKPLPFAAGPVDSIASGGFACMIGSDHQLYCFGDAYYIGDGSFLVSPPSPVKVVW
jgi:hypothetical protein